jgi:hypothetical protein
VELVQQIFLPNIPVPAVIAANTAFTVTLNVKGLRLYDLCAVTLIGQQLGLILSSAYVSARDTVVLIFGNVTAVPLNNFGPYTAVMTVVRSSVVLDGGPSALPTAIQ